MSINLIKEFKAQSEEWKRFRMSNITGTDCASLFQLNPYQSKNVIIKDKTSDEIKKHFDNKYAQAGRMLEPGVIIKLNDLKYKVKAAGKHNKVIVLHNEQTKLSASLDAIYTFHKRKYITEIKTTSYEKWQNWINEGLPLYYLLQVQVQIILKPEDYENGALLVTCARQDPTYPLAVYKISFNNEIKVIVENEVQRFWSDPESFDYNMGCKDQLQELLPLTATLIKLYDIDS